MYIKTETQHKIVAGKAFKVYRVSVNGIQTRMFTEQYEPNAYQLLQAYLDELHYIKSLQVA